MSIFANLRADELIPGDMFDPINSGSTAGFVKITRVRVVENDGAGTDRIEITYDGYGICKTRTLMPNSMVRVMVNK